MNLYAHPANELHEINNARFLEIAKSYSHLSFFQPAPEKAPWHWQAVIDLGGDPQILSFWPHLLKGQREGYKSVEGEMALRGIIEGALVDASPDHSFDLFEDSEGGAS